MMRKSWIALLLTGVFLLVLRSGAQGETTTLEFRAADLATFATAREELGTFHTLQFTVPKDVIGKRLDIVLLEIYVDVFLNEDSPDWATPVIEMLPLTSAFAGDGVPEFVTTSTAVQNVVPGERKKLLLDITEMAKGWIANPTTNHGVIIGTLTGPKDGTFTVRDDVLDGGKVAKVTFFYQNRFGGRVSH